jgi:hypothetical protein
MRTRSAPPPPLPTVSLFHSLFTSCFLFPVLRTQVLLHGNRKIIFPCPCLDLQTSFVCLMTLGSSSDTAIIFSLGILSFLHQSLSDLASFAFAECSQVSGLGNLYCVCFERQITSYQISERTGRYLY